MTTAIRRKRDNAQTRARFLNALPVENLVFFFLLYLLQEKKVVLNFSRLISISFPNLFCINREELQEVKETQKEKQKEETQVCEYFCFASFHMIRIFNIFNLLGGK